MSKYVSFADGKSLPAIGQGTWYMGEKITERTREVKAIQHGIDLGLKIIDTAEMYANGGAERVVGEALIGRRDKVFLVSKVYPWNAGCKAAIEACENSLRRLKTDYLDLYLLHWRGSIPLEQTIAAMEALIQQGKICRWGVSNFDNEDMHELWQQQGGEACATNQVLYHLASRGIEYDLLPLCQQYQLPLMAYCPLAQAGRLRRDLLTNPGLNTLAGEKNISVAQLLLAWVIRNEGVIAIPKASSEVHVTANAAALDIRFSTQELTQIERCFPAPKRSVPLDIV